jgi:hypothetical protein
MDYVLAFTEILAVYKRILQGIKYLTRAPASSKLYITTELSVPRLLAHLNCSPLKTRRQEKAGKWTFYVCGPGVELIMDPSHVGKPLEN